MMAVLVLRKRLCHPHIMRVYFLCLIFVCSFVNASMAQDRTSVRASDHKDYSRLVFDWGSHVEYDLQKKQGSFTLSFKNTAEIDFGQVALTPLRNIQAISLDEGTAQKFIFSVPGNVRIRDFFVGNRVVIDVYNPPGPVAESKRPQIAGPKKAGEVKKPEKPKQTSGEEAKVQSVASHDDQTPLEKARAAIQEILQVDVDVDLVGEDADKSEKDDSDDDLADLNKEKSKSELQRLRERIDKIGTNLITISSTSPTGMAVFRRGSEIWMVNDQPDLLVNPRLSGPNANYLSPVRRMDLPDGKIFQVNDLDDAFLRVQGGGLVWRVIVTGDSNNDKALKPVRHDVVEGVSRGGSVIWPFKDVNSILDVPDMESGRIIKVVVVNNATEFSGAALDFVDFSVFPSAAGMAILPKVDDLEVRKTPDGIEVSRASGLALSGETEILAAALVRKNKNGIDYAETRVYDFKNWLLGDITGLRDNQNIILSTLPGLTLSAKVEGILTLSKMYLSHGFWSEALGFLEYAQEELPELIQNPEFIAVKGAVQALGFNSEEAFNTLSSEELNDFEEVGYWKAHVLADLGDWQQGYESLPKSVKTLGTYPKNIVSRVGLSVAEVALRAGDVDLAEQALEIVREYEDDLFFEQQAALQYLTGEILRQNGDIDGAINLWEELATGRDDMHRAKAGLALVRLKMEQKTSTVAESIDNLERLRYAWRGDELEAQINHWLGRTYFNAGVYVKGLNIMREAASLAAGLALGQRITGEMTEMFTELLLDPDPEKLSPLEAAALYEQFGELIPTGPKGDEVVKRLAEYLVSGDVLGRAAQLLQRQVDHRLHGLDAYETAVRLTAIYLLDDQVTPAAKALNKAHVFYNKLPDDQKTKARELEQNLLKARIMAGLGRPDQAIELLRGLPPGSSVANRLWAGIAWDAGYWDDAAEALYDVIVDQNISLTRPLSDENAMMILQQAVALNLSSDRIGLANLREKYTQSMQQTDRARLFEVVTRPRQSAALADRDTLLSIVSEVDLFKDFLDSYKDATKPLN